MHRTVVQKRALNKNTKQKSTNKDNASDVQSKADSDEDIDSETVIGEAPNAKKQKHSVHFCDGSTKSSACDEVQMLKLTYMFVNTANE